MENTKSLRNKKHFLLSLPKTLPLPFCLSQSGQPQGERSFDLAGVPWARVDQVTTTQGSSQDRERAGTSRPRVLSTPCCCQIGPAGAGFRRDGDGAFAPGKLFAGMCTRGCMSEREKERKGSGGWESGDEDHLERSQARPAMLQVGSLGAQAAARVQL